ncbi:two-component system, chemotaxis family, response regulator CheY [Rhizobiales bacterium GAS191]|jgi:two-component system chemotaxis response regulator CheY|nr:two-component system, chemotaxis family, response regulator CheY [Rhizobiales bacterium GAS113]SEC60304.1 two-component system, chemotaxis family, response regulator CheY [Rhizobiales bacterium GAS188]SEC68251.1 two-component system, chemotaxis family, response regulator CheY [Rhizobiales bacterium GAS191]
MSILEQLKILVVDDMTTSRMLLIEALQEIGFRQISYAKNGQDGLKLLMSNPVHMVISDFEMPGLDGVGLLQGIRSNPTTRNIPFIMVTGRGDRALVERASKFGLNNFVTKPFTVASLRTALRAVLKGI